MKSDCDDKHGDGKTFRYNSSLSWGGLHPFRNVQYSTWGEFFKSIVYTNTSTAIGQYVLTALSKLNSILMVGRRYLDIMFVESGSSEQVVKKYALSLQIGKGDYFPETSILDAQIVTSHHVGKVTVRISSTDISLSRLHCILELKLNLVSFSQRNELDFDTKLEIQKGKQLSERYNNSLISQ